MTDNGHFDEVVTLDAPSDDAPAEQMREIRYLSPEWFTVQIAAHEQIVAQSLARVTATDEYQGYMREVGALNLLKSQQAELLKH